MTSTLPNDNIRNFDDQITNKLISEIIMGLFNTIDMLDVEIKPGLAKDSVQMDKRNEADTYISKWWMPKTSITDGITKVFEEMKKDF